MKFITLEYNKIRKNDFVKRKEIDYTNNWTSMCDKYNIAYDSIFRINFIGGGSIDMYTLDGVYVGTWEAVRFLHCKNIRTNMPSWF